MTSAPPPATIYAKLVLVALAWGGTFIGVRVLATAMAPSNAAVWRYVIASVVLLLLVFVREGGLPRLTRVQWLGVAVLGATGVAAFNFLFMLGMHTVPASRGSLVVALNPAATLVGAALFLHERLTRNKILGIVIALFGVSVVLGHGDPRHLLDGGIGQGEAALFGCVLAWAAYTLLGKRVLKGLTPLAATTYAALIGTVLLAVVALVLGEFRIPELSWRVGIAFAFVGVIGTALAFVWFYEGVLAIGPARAAVFINLVPVFAIALGVLLLGEPLEWSMLAGGAIVVVGIYLINRPQAVSRAAIPAGL